MTDCNLIREELVAFLDGELDAARTGEVTTHLASCGACERERQALVKAWQNLELLPGLEPRAGWMAEVEAKILRDAAGAPPLQVLAGGRSSSGGRAVKRWIAAAAAVLMAAGASLIVVTWPASTNDVALKADKPAPVPPKPVPVVLVEPVAPDDPDPVVVVEPGVDPLAALPAEERELVENLELLRDLEELEALGLLDAAEMFDDLDEEEFDEG